ncbi:MAG: helix-turn-helix domain-containing protein [Bacteroidales bacterium]|nr:helix-turn-helix domain-containing protein [Bacteroidales bacterium]
MKRIVLAALIWTVSAIGLSGAPAYSFRHYTVRDGLSSNTVRALIQDRKGLIWLGTSDGLDSFDGKSIVHHPFGTEGSRYVNALFEDADDILWVGTDDAVFRYVNDSLYRLPGFPETAATGFIQDRDGSVWISSFEDGVSRWRDGEITRFLEGDIVEYLFVSKDGRLWIADPASPEGLYVFNPASGAFVPPGLRFDGCSPARICTIAQDIDGILWLGTWDHGLYRLDPATRTVRCVAPPGKGFNHVHSLTEVSPWNFLIGSDDGLLYVNPLTGEQFLYGNDRKDPASLSNKFVYPIVLDHEGGIWIGTYYGGVNYIAPGSSVFSFLSLSDLTGAAEDFTISCLCEDPDGSLWMGSDNGGLFRYDPAKGTATRQYPARLALKNIHALLRQGAFLWVGTYSSDLIRINVRTGQEKVYSPEDGLDARSVYSLYQAPDGTLWAGTDKGVCRYDPASDRFIPEYSASNVIVDIAEDQNGILWVATTGKGLLKRSPDGKWQNLTVHDAGLPSNDVTCLMPSEKGMFAATRNGLVLLGGETEVYLEGMDIQYLTDDGAQLWLTTPSSLIRFIPDSGTLEQFGAGDGIRCGQFLPGSGLSAREGKIYLGATDGVVSFFPGGVVENRIPPTVLITRFHALGPGLYEDVLRTQGTDDIRISWRKRDLRFSFAALSYCAPEKVRYAYRLEGLDPHWKMLGNQNLLSLDQVPAGHYRLQVIACNNSGVWNQEGASISFTIRNHPLLSNVALFLYLLLFFLLLSLMVRWLLRRTEKKSRVRFERKLDEAVTQVKEEERDDRYQFVSSLADQLEAPLAGISAQLERLGSHPKALSDIRGEITLIEKNHRMLKGISSSLKLLRGSLAPENGPETAGAATAEDDFLTRLDQLITENLANPALSVSFLAQEMATSRSGLFDKVKKLTGDTPNNLINQTRLNAAAKLLSEGRHSVGEICYLTGFSSPSYFSKSFSAQFGFTPYEWMQMHKD